MKTHWNTLEKSRRQLPSSPQDLVGPQGRLAAFCSAIFRLMGRLVNMGIYCNRLLFTFTVSPVDASCESTKEKRRMEPEAIFTVPQWHDLLSCSRSLLLLFLKAGRQRGAVPRHLRKPELGKTKGRDGELHKVSHVCVTTACHGLHPQEAGVEHNQVLWYRPQAS